MERIKTMLSVALPMWMGILLIYTFEMKPLIGFFLSAVLWRLTRLDSKRKLNGKKLLLIALLVSMSGNYKASELSAEEYLTVNQKIEWAISLSLIAISVAIFFKRGTQEDFPLIMGLISGLCGLEDMTAIILISMLGKMILRLEEGTDVGREYKKSVQQAGKIYKL